MAWYDTAVNAAVGVGTTFLDNFFGGRRAEHDRERNYYWNSKAAQRDYELAKEWYDTYQTPAAIMGQIQQAGLSPSMMAKGALGSGQGSGVGSHGAGDGVQSPFYDLGGKAMQVAQIDLMRAEANKANAEAQNARGEGEMGEALLAKAWEEAGATKASKELIKAQTTREQLENYITDQTKEFSIEEARIMLNKLCYEQENAYEQLRISKVNAEISEETKNEAIQQIRLQNSLILANYWAKLAEKKLTEQQIKNLQNDIQTAWAELDLKLQDIQTKETSNEIKQKEYEETIREFNKTFDQMQEQIGIKKKEYELNKWKAAREFGEKITENSHLGSEKMSSRDTKKESYKPAKIE